MAGTVACIEDMRNIHKIIAEKFKGKTLLRAPRRTLGNIVCLSVWGGPESLGIFVSSP
jgi:hypothetical protein